MILTFHGGWESDEKKCLKRFLIGKVIIKTKACKRLPLLVSSCSTEEVIYFWVELLNLKEFGIYVTASIKK